MDGGEVEMAQKESIEAEGKRISRRALLRGVSWLGAGWAIFVASCVASTAALARFFFPNALFEPPSLFRAGYISEYTEIGAVYTQWKQKYGVWLVREVDRIYALSTACTHLGCTPNWLPTEQKFKCPCHGSGFHKSGINFEGPAPRPLERFRILIADDGQIQVDKSKLFKQEKREWELPESYLLV